MTEHHGYPVPLDGHRRSDGLGHVYVAQFGNDDIKIGHTTSPGRRFRNLDGGLNRVARTWLSVPHRHFRVSERELLRMSSWFVRSNGASRGEYFRGIYFSDVMHYAEHLPAWADSESRDRCRLPRCGQLGASNVIATVAGHADPLVITGITPRTVTVVLGVFADGPELETHPIAEVQPWFPHRSRPAPGHLTPPEHREEGTGEPNDNAR